MFQEDASAMPHPNAAIKTRSTVLDAQPQRKIIIALVGLALVGVGASTVLSTEGDNSFRNQDVAASDQHVVASETSSALFHKSEVATSQPSRGERPGSAGGGTTLKFTNFRWPDIDKDLTLIKGSTFAAHNVKGQGKRMLCTHIGGQEIFMNAAKSRSTGAMTIQFHATGLTAFCQLTVHYSIALLITTMSGTDTADIPIASGTTVSGTIVAHGVDSGSPRLTISDCKAQAVIGESGIHFKGSHSGILNEFAAPKIKRNVNSKAGPKMCEQIAKKLATTDFSLPPNKGQLAMLSDIAAIEN